MTQLGKGSRYILSVASEEGLALRNVQRVCVEFDPALDQASGIPLRFSRPVKARQDTLKSGKNVS